MTGIDQDVAAIGRVEAVATILEVVCRTTGMGLAVVARVTPERWVACAVRDAIGFGLVPGGELDVRTTFCREVRDGAQPVIVGDLAADPAYREHPVCNTHGLRSYIAFPIRRGDGQVFGTLCAFDKQPRRLDDPATTGMFALFADLIGFHLDAQDRLQASAEALAGERLRAELREQFIAVLGHDLRNPLASIAAGVDLLGKQPLDARGRATLELMARSARRMAELIDNVLDLARGQLGGGIEVALDDAAALAPALEQVVGEARAVWPDRSIEVSFRLDEPVRCDPARIAQLLSNLLANALQHGSHEAPVEVSAAAASGWLEIAVTNRGRPIPDALRDQLFQPFVRASTGHQGLGLGLYIAQSIAAAHGGTLEVVSDVRQTRFTFRMATA